MIVSRRSVMILASLALGLGLVSATAPAARAQEDSFVGLGLQLGTGPTAQGFCVVKAVIQMAGADVKALVRKNDEITHVDGKSVKGMIEYSFWPHAHPCRVPMLPQA